MNPGIPRIGSSLVERGAIFGATWRHLEPFGATFGATWSHLEPSGAIFGAAWSHLEFFGAVLGAIAFELIWIILRRILLKSILIFTLNFIKLFLTMLIDPIN